MSDVRPGRPADRAEALETLSAAFASDPLLRWLFPHDDLWPARSHAFFGHLFDTRVEGGEIRVTDDLAAVSLWNPPGGNRLDPEEWQGSWQRAAGTFSEDELARWERFVEIADREEPDGAYWYLGVVGVRPERHGQGLGGRVIRSILDRADEGGTPAYLETALESNLAVYARLGFTTVVYEATVPSGPTLWGLWREPAG